MCEIKWIDLLLCLFTAYLRFVTSDVKMCFTDAGSESRDDVIF